MRWLVLSLALAGPVAAQDAQTLADIRQELSVLAVEMQRLKQELSTTGAPRTPAIPQSMYDRMELLDTELRRLTARTEELSYRIDRIVADGTNRLGDLEFRLCELDPDCDLGAIGQASTLGGGEAPPAPAAPAPQGGVSQLALSEQRDFDRAREALDSGSFQSAAELFAAFADAYPGGPLTAESHLLRGEALAKLGETAPAARAFLIAFSSDPAGPLAPWALLKLGQGLERLGQTDEACVTLGEVSARFPDSAAAPEAGEVRASLRCP